MRREGFDTLPREIQVNIFSYIPHDEYRSVRLVNRLFNDISYDKSLWKKVSVHHIVQHWNDWNYWNLCCQFLQVDLVFPRNIRQIRQLANEVFPSISLNGVVEELKITGFIRDPVVDRGGRPRIDYFPGHNSFRDRLTPKTVSFPLLAEIQASSPGLKTLIIRNCCFSARTRYEVCVNIPESLQKLEFHNCR